MAKAHKQIVQVAKRPCDRLLLPEDPTLGYCPGLMVARGVSDPQWECCLCPNVKKIITG